MSGAGSRFLPATHRRTGSQPSRRTVDQRRADPRPRDRRARRLRRRPAARGHLRTGRGPCGGRRRRSAYHGRGRLRQAGRLRGVTGRGHRHGGAPHGGARAPAACRCCAARALSAWCRWPTPPRPSNGWPTARTAAANAPRRHFRRTAEDPATRPLLRALPANPPRLAVDLSPHRHRRTRVDRGGSADPVRCGDHRVPRSSSTSTAAWLCSTSLLAVSSVTGPAPSNWRSRSTAAAAGGSASSPR
jgi:hypothetical protein